MHHRFDGVPLEDLAQRLSIANVGLHEDRLAGDRVAVTAGEVVVHQNLIAAREEPLGDDATDVTCATGNEDQADTLLMPLELGSSGIKTNGRGGRKAACAPEYPGARADCGAWRTPKTPAGL